MADALPDFYTIGPYPNVHLGFIEFPSYYFIISLSYCLCILWFYKRCEDRNLPTQQAMDMGMIILIAGFLGARLFHVFFEIPDYYRENPQDIFYLWQGGYVFFGGFITAYLAAVFYAHKQKLNFWLWHDTLAPIIAFGYSLGRVACFFTGCCYGKVCNWPWAVSLKQVHVHNHSVEYVSRHPTQLYATFFELGILALLLWYEKQKPKQGNIFLIWLILHSLGRILMESFRDDPRGSTHFGLSISTNISIILLVCALGALTYRNQKRIHR